MTALSEAQELTYTMRKVCSKCDKEKSFNQFLKGYSVCNHCRCETARKARIVEKKSSPAKCLKCSSSFIPLSRFNRLCETCGRRNQELQGLIHSSGFTFH